MSIYMELLLSDDIATEGVGSVLSKIGKTIVEGIKHLIKIIRRLVQRIGRFIKSLVHFRKEKENKEEGDMITVERQRTNAINSLNIKMSSYNDKVLKRDAESSKGLHVYKSLLDSTLKIYDEVSKVKPFFKKFITLPLEDLNAGDLNGIKFSEDILTKCEKSLSDASNSTEEIAIFIMSRSNGVQEVRKNIDFLQNIIPELEKISNMADDVAKKAESYPTSSEFINNAFKKLTQVISLLTKAIQVYERAITLAENKITSGDRERMRIERKNLDQEEKEIQKQYLDEINQKKAENHRIFSGGRTSKEYQEYYRKTHPIDSK